MGARGTNAAMTQPEEGDRRDVSRVLEEMDAHPSREPLAKLVLTLVLTGFDERRRELDQGIAEAASRLAVDEPTSETSFGNVLRALKKGISASGPERMLVGALAAMGATHGEPDAKTIHALVWTAAHTPFDPLEALSRLGNTERKTRVAEVYFDLARRYDDGDATVDRPTALVAALELGKRRSPEISQRARVALRDPMMLAMIAPPVAAAGEQTIVRGVSAEPVGFDAEITAPPRHIAWTVVLLVTFLLPFVAAFRAIGRWVLRLKEPATISVSKTGVTIKSRLELLGRTLRERETFMPSAGLESAAREVRYPALPTYIGIASLLLGSFIGLRLVMDGARSGSPEFLSLGVALLLGGLALDYVLSRFPLRTPDRCRLLFTPQKGRPVALVGAPRGSADRALETLKP